MTIKSKLASSAACTAVLVILVASISIYFSFSVEKKVKSLTRQSTPAQIKTIEVQQTVDGIGADFLRLSVAPNTSEVQRVTALIDAKIEQLRKTSDDLKGMGESVTVDIGMLSLLRNDAVKAVTGRITATDLTRSPITKLCSLADSFPR